MTQLTLYGTDMPNAGCVNIWTHWTGPIPQRGDKIPLHEGDWTVKYRRTGPSIDGVEVYAHPPDASIIDRLRYRLRDSITGDDS